MSPLMGVGQTEPSPSSYRESESEWKLEWDLAWGRGVPCSLTQAPIQAPTRKPNPRQNRVGVCPIPIRSDIQGHSGNSINDSTGHHRTPNSSSYPEAGSEAEVEPEDGGRKTGFPGCLPIPLLIFTCTEGFLPKRKYQGKGN